MLIVSLQIQGKEQVMTDASFVFDKTNFHTITKLFSSLLGKDFINQISSYDTTGRKEHEIKKLDSRAHPMCKLWRSLKQAIKQTEEQDKLVLNDDSIFLLNLYFAIVECTELKGKERILRTLKNRKEFYSSCHELDVARQYINMGFSVEAIPETNNKTPDFKVTTLAGDTVYVEAKQLEDQKKNEDPKWQSLIKEIEKILVRHKKSLLVEVFAKDVVSNINKEETLKLINDYCVSYYTQGNCKASSEYCDIHISKICDWDSKFENEIGFSDSGDISTFSVSAINNGNTTTMSNVKAIRVTKYTKLDIQKTIKNNIQKASKQATNDFPLVVHVGLPNKKSSELFAIADYVQNQIANDVNRHFSKVNAVVITGSFLDKNSKGINPTRELRMIVPNFATKNEMPKSFRFYKDERSLISSAGDEGLVTFGYDKNYFKKSLEDEISGEVVSLCSYDGRNQLRIYLTERALLRLQVICPKYKYRNFDLKAKESDFLDGSKISIKWSGMKSEVYIDEKRVVSKLVI